MDSYHVAFSMRCLQHGDVQNLCKYIFKFYYKLKWRFQLQHYLCHPRRTLNLGVQVQEERRNKADKNRQWCWLSALILYSELYLIIDSLASQTKRCKFTIG